MQLNFKIIPGITVGGYAKGGAIQKDMKTIMQFYELFMICHVHSHVQMPRKADSARATLCHYVMVKLQESCPA